MFCGLWVENIQDGFLLSLGIRINHDLGSRGPTAGSQAGKKILFVSSLPGSLLAQPVLRCRAHHAVSSVTSAWHRCTEEQNNSSFFSSLPAMASYSTSALGKAGTGVGVQALTNDRVAGDHLQRRDLRPPGVTSQGNAVTVLLHHVQMSS